MSDEMSIRDSLEKKKQRRRSLLNNDDALDDAGEVAWDLEAPELEEEVSQVAEASPFAGMPGFGADDEEEEPPKGPGADLGRFIRGIKKRKLIVLVCVIIFGLLFFYLGTKKLKHNKWTVSSTLVQRTSLDTWALGGSAAYEPQKYLLDMLLEALKSPAVFEVAARRAGKGVDAGALASAVSVESDTKTKIVHVSLTWDQKEQAAPLLNHIVDAYLEQVMALRRGDAEESFQYYDSQLLAAQKKVQAVIDELSNFKKDNDISDIAVQTKALLENMTKMKGLLTTREAEYAAITNDYKALKEHWAVMPDKVIKDELYRSPLKARLGDLEWKYEQMKSRYTEKNPKVLEVLARIKKLKEMIAAGKDKTAPEVTYAPNREKAALGLEMIRLQNQISLVNAQLSALKSNVASGREQLRMLMSKSKEYESLVARKASMDALLKGLSSRVQETRVLMTRNIRDFDVIQRAMPAGAPLPNKGKMLRFLGLILGALIGVVIAIILELRDKRMMTLRDLLGFCGVEAVMLENQTVPDGLPMIIDTKKSMEITAINYRRFLNELGLKRDPEDWQSLAVISADDHAGATLVATNLAQALAMKEERVVLLDADLSSDAGMRPAELYELPLHKAGFLEYIEQGLSMRAVLHRTETANVRLIPASAEAKAPDEALLALGSRRAQEAIETLRKLDGHVVYDVPTFAKWETVYEFIQSVGAVLVVARSGQTMRPDMEVMIERLKEAEVDIIAGVMVDVPPELMQGKAQYDTSEIREAAKRVQKEKRQRQWASIKLALKKPGTLFAKKPKLLLSLLDKMRKRKKGRRHEA